MITPEQIENVKKHGARIEVLRKAEEEIKEAMDTLKTTNPHNIKVATSHLKDAITYLESLL